MEESSARQSTTLKCEARGKVDLDRHPFKKYIPILENLFFMECWPLSVTVTTYCLQTIMYLSMLRNSRVRGL